MSRAAGRMLGRIRDTEVITSAPRTGRISPIRAGRPIVRSPLSTEENGPSLMKRDGAETKQERLNNPKVAGSNPAPRYQGRPEGEKGREGRAGKADRDLEGRPQGRPSSILGSWPSRGPDSNLFSNSHGRHVTMDRLPDRVQVRAELPNLKSSAGSGFLRKRSDRA